MSDMTDAASATPSYPPPVPIDMPMPAELRPIPPLETVAIPQPQPTAQYVCARGHRTPAIGLYFSAAMLGGDPTRGVLRDRRFCYICVVEMLERNDVSEVERLEG
jgi:hypothetical protein